MDKYPPPKPHPHPIVVNATGGHIGRLPSAGLHNEKRRRKKAWVDKGGVPLLVYCKLMMGDAMKTALSALFALICLAFIGLGGPVKAQTEVQTPPSEANQQAAVEGLSVEQLI